MRIKILSHKYKVIISQKKFAKETSDAFGLCNNLQHKIWLSETQKKSARDETYFHEIIEAINYKMGIGLDHDKQLVPLSETLIHVLKQNGMWKSPFKK